jgi:hypothetical protein
MRTIERAAVGVTGLLGLTIAAWAAEMTAAELKELVSGKTVYLETTPDSTGGVGQGAIYYNTDGTSLYKTAKGPILHGKWTIKENTVCNDWKEQPGNSCSKYDKQGNTINIINVATGKVRSKILKTVPGNAEKIAP